MLFRSKARAAGPGVVEQFAEGREVHVRPSAQFTSALTLPEVGRVLVRRSEVRKIAGSAETFYNLLAQTFELHKKGVQGPVVAMEVDDPDTFRAEVRQLLTNQRSGLSPVERSGPDLQEMLELFMKGFLIELVKSAEVQGYAARNSKFGGAAIGDGTYLQGVINFTGVDEAKQGIKPLDRPLLYPTLVLGFSVLARLARSAKTPEEQLEITALFLLNGKIFTGARVVLTQDQRLELDNLKQVLEFLLIAQKYVLTAA